MHTTTLHHLLDWAILETDTKLIRLKPHSLKLEHNMSTRW